MSNYFETARRVSAENVSTWNQPGGLDESRDRPRGRRFLKPTPISSNRASCYHRGREVTLVAIPGPGAEVEKSSASANRGIGRTLDFPLERVGWFKDPKSRTPLLPCKSSVNNVLWYQSSLPRVNPSSRPLLLVVFDSPA